MDQIMESLTEALRVGRQKKAGKMVRGGKVVQQKAGVAKKKTGKAKMAAVRALAKARRGTAKQKALKSKKRGRAMGIYDDSQQERMVQGHDGKLYTLIPLEEQGKQMSAKEVSNKIISSLAGKYGKPTKVTVQSIGGRDTYNAFWEDQEDENKLYSIAKAASVVAKRLLGGSIRASKDKSGTSYIMSGGTGSFLSTVTIRDSASSHLPNFAGVIVEMDKV